MERERLEAALTEWIDADAALAVGEAVSQLVDAMLKLIPLVDGDDGGGHIRVGHMLVTIGQKLATSERPDGV